MVSNNGGSARPALGANLINTLFITPRAQTHIFDLDYQLYLFKLLHQVSLNGWVHYIQYFTDSEKHSSGHAKIGG